MSNIGTLETLPIPVAADYQRLKEWCTANKTHGVITPLEMALELADIPHEHLRALHDAALISAGFDEDFTIHLFAVEELLTDESPVGGLSFVATDAREYMTI